MRTHIKTYKELPKSFGMQLLAFAPKHTQIYMLIDTFPQVCTANVCIYLIKNKYNLSVQFFTRTTPGPFGLSLASIDFDCFPLGIQEFLNNLLTK